MRYNKNYVRNLMRAALLEDAAGRDRTTQDFIPAACRVEARIVAREPGVVCGTELAAAVFRTFDPKLRVRLLKKDSWRVRRNETILLIKGSARSVLSSERVALNFLGYLSGIATQTSAVVSEVRRQGIKILDTRKTTPLMRPLEKYAVRMGGGVNHRFNLADQYLLKDNHILILKKTVGFDGLKRRRRGIRFEIEVEDLAELKRALEQRPDIVLLDNFSPRQVRRAVGFLAKTFPSKKRRPKVELSGGITPANIRPFAIRGVDYISLGALTHSARALDVSLEIVSVRHSR